MTTIAALSASLDALEAVQRRLGAIGRRTDPERAHDLIQGRRDFAHQLQAVMTEGDALFAAVGDATLQREFRHRFSTMRAAAAALQAAWPAVKVRDEGGERYTAAVAAVRASDQACIAWTRETLKTLTTTRKDMK